MLESGKEWPRLLGRTESDTSEAPTFRSHQPLSWLTRAIQIILPMNRPPLWSLASKMQSLRHPLCSDGLRPCAEAARTSSFTSIPIWVTASAQALEQAPKDG